MNNPDASTGGAAQATPDITIETKGAAGVVTFERVRALNALTTQMRERMGEAFTLFARNPQIYAVVLASASPKAFSAGGDVRELVKWGREDRARAERAFADEYRLNWRLECFSKPTISLIDGMVMGSGVGVSLFGTHRVAGEGYRFAMPETAIGLFPDVGVAHAFARMPHGIGNYLGLTGRAVGRADALQLGLATHCIGRGHFDEIVAALTEAEPVDPLLDKLHADPGEGEIAHLKGLIADTFEASRVEEIVERLGRIKGAGQEWAGAVLTELSKRSPLSLKITLRHIQGAAGQDLRGVLETDYRLACRCLEGHDFAEGVRAALIDKDGRPNWVPARLEDVTEDMVEACFRPLPGGELNLPTRDEMQAARA